MLELLLLEIGQLWGTKERYSEPGHIPLIALFSLLYYVNPSWLWRKPILSLVLHLVANLKSLLSTKWAHVCLAVSWFGERGHVAWGEVVQSESCKARTIHCRRFLFGVSLRRLPLRLAGNWLQVCNPCPYLSPLLRGMVIDYVKDLNAEHK